MDCLAEWTAKKGKVKHMKRVLAVVLTLLFATASFAGEDAIVHWQRIVGVITAPGVPNRVARITSGRLPWTASNGWASLDLATGHIAFLVRGLVLVGGNSSGTPGTVTSVKGTLVCNPGTAGQVVIDTPAVPLDSKGDAQFLPPVQTVGDLVTALPSPCTNPLFLIRVVPEDVWIATGAVRITSTP
jgi:hypothetical protein